MMNGPSLNGTGVGVSVGVSDGVRVSVGVNVSVGVGVTLGVCVSVGVRVGEGVLVIEGVWVALARNARAEVCVINQAAMTTNTHTKLITHRLMTTCFKRCLGDEGCGDGIGLFYLQGNFPQPVKGHIGRPARGVLRMAAVGQLAFRPAFR